MHVAAVSVDPPQTAAALAKRLELTFPLLADVHRKLTRTYGLHDKQNNIPWPAVYLIGKSGKVVWRWVATSYKKRPSVQDLVGALGKLEVKLPGP